MLFENKTNSEILANLKVDEKILKYVYMSGDGAGLELLEALHHVVSPEEIYKHYKAFGIPKTQVEKLKVWLGFNCDLKLTRKAIGLGYGYTLRALGDNGGYGLLTKIRRNLIEWEPKVTPSGEVEFTTYKWLKDPEVVFENDTYKVIMRAYEERREYRSKIYESERDNFYEQHTFCFTKDEESGTWRKCDYGEKKELIESLIMVAKLTGSYSKVYPPILARALVAK